MAQHRGTPFEITLGIKQKIKILLTNKMKKSIFTLALSVPFAIFAQNDMLNNANQNNDPFAAINNGTRLARSTSTLHKLLRCSTSKTLSVVLATSAAD